MSSQRLSKLEALSQNRADQSRDAAVKQRAELSVIDRQHLELKAINREYQDGLIAMESVSPQLLAQRRNFVASLTQKLEQLQHKRQQQNNRLSEILVEQHQRTAETAALGTMVERGEKQEAHVVARRERLQLEASIHALQHLRQHESEDDRV